MEDAAAVILDNLGRGKLGDFQVGSRTDFIAIFRGVSIHL